MKNNKLCVVGLALGGALFCACPSSSPGDAGGRDASPADVVQLDSVQDVDAAQDAGCAQPCEQENGDRLGVEGACDGTLLRYCENNCVVERDCAGMAGGPYSCGLYAPFYECLAGAGQSCEPNYWDCDPATNCTGQQPCDENAGLYCEQRDNAYLCVHTEAGDAGTDAGTEQEDAGTSDAGETDAQSSDATAPDAMIGDVAIEDAHQMDAAGQDVQRADSAQQLEDVGPTTGDAAHLSEDAAGNEDAGDEDRS